eukprot:scaffold49596_cov41-Prasinocladus_malaysianus.AAC.3
MSRKPEPWRPRPAQSSRTAAETGWLPRRPLLYPGTAVESAAPGPAPPAPPRLPPAGARWPVQPPLPRPRPLRGFQSAPRRPPHGRAPPREPPARTSEPDRADRSPPGGRLSLELLPKLLRHLAGRRLSCHHRLGHPSKLFAGGVVVCAQRLAGLAQPVFGLLPHNLLGVGHVTKPVDHRLREPQLVPELGLLREGRLVGGLRASHDVLGGGDGCLLLLHGRLLLPKGRKGLLERHFGAGQRCPLPLQGLFQARPRHKLAVKLQLELGYPRLGSRT